jgi:hypothetical protein
MKVIREIITLGVTEIKQLRAVIEFKNDLQEISDLKADLKKKRAIGSVLFPNAAGKNVSKNKWLVQ